jgi:hypothetical protein
VCSAENRVHSYLHCVHYKSHDDEGCGVCVCSCGCAAVHQPYEVTYSGIKNFGLEYRRGETVRKKQQGCSSTTRPAGLPEKKRVFDVF